MMLRIFSSQIKRSVIPKKLLHFQKMSQIKYNFSNKLNESQFSHQLGLDKQFQKVKDIQKSNESKAVRSSSILIVFAMTVFGSYLFIQFIDNHEKKLWIYRFKQICQSLKIKNNKYFQEEKQIHIEHQNNLKEIYDKLYKNRTHIDSKYLQNIRQYVVKVIDKAIKSSRNQAFTNSEYKFGDNMLYIINQLSQKKQIFQDESLHKTTQKIIQIFQKIIWYQIKNVNKVQNQRISIGLKNQLSQKISLCLLKYGNIDQQLLGYKYFLTNFNPQLFFSSTSKKLILLQIEKNKQILTKSKKETQQQIKKIKFQILPELQNSYTIKRKKCKVLENIFNESGQKVVK